MTKLNIPGMTCGHCKSTVEKTVKDVDANASITVDLESRVVSIESETSDAALIEALKANGYEATVA